MFVLLRAASRGAVLVSLALALSGCGSEPPPDPAQPPATRAGSDSDTRSDSGAPAAAPETAEAARAEAALRADRLFVPPGDNAFELFLLAVEADPANSRLRAALDDLVPYAVLHVEQRSAARDRAEAERVLSLIERAQPQAPALPRLRREVQALEAAAPAAAAAAVPPAAPAPAPAAPTTAPAQSSPATSVSAAAASPAPQRRDSPVNGDAETAQEAPSGIEPSSPVAAAAQSEAVAPPANTSPAPAPGSRSQARIPQLIQRPPPRYPPLAERRRIEGEVELEFTIAADGSVTDIEVIRAEPEGIFEREAIGALQRWRYAQPEAPMRARRTLEFRLSR